MERMKAQEIVDSDHLWGKLNADEKFSVLRVSMGLPPSVDSSIHTAEEIEQWQQSSEVRFDKVIQRLSQPLMGQSDDQVKDRTLFVRIHLEEYLISWEVLDQVFSSVGNLEIIEIFDNDAQFHSRIRFQNRDSALKAFDSYNGRCIYDGCCRMELFFFNDRNSGESRADTVQVQLELQSVDYPCTEVKEPIMGDIVRKSEEHLELSKERDKHTDQELEPTVELVEKFPPRDRSPITTAVSPISSGRQSDFEIGIVVAKSGEELEEPPKMSKMVTNRSHETSNCNVCWENNFKGDSGAHHVFDKMSDIGIGLTNYGAGANSKPEANSNLEASRGRQEQDRNILGKPPEEENLKCREEFVKWREVGEATNPEIDKDIEEIQKQHTCFKVISVSCEAMVIDVESKEIDELVDMSIDWIAIERSSFNTTSVSSLKISSAQDMFEEMPIRGFKGNHFSNQLNNNSNLKVAQGFFYRPHCDIARDDISTLCFDPGIAYETEIANRFVVQQLDGRLHDFNESLCVKLGKKQGFDPGGDWGYMDIWVQTVGSSWRNFNKTVFGLILSPVPVMELSNFVDKRVDFVQLLAQDSDVFDEFAGFLKGELGVLVHSITRSGTVNTMKTKGVVFDPGINESLNYKSDGLSKHVVEQESLQLEGYGLVLILESHSNELKLLPNCYCDSWIVDLKLGDIITLFDPGIVSCWKFDRWTFVFDPGVVDHAKVAFIHDYFEETHDVPRLEFSSYQTLGSDVCSRQDHTSFPYDRGKAKVATSTPPG